MLIRKLQKSVLLSAAAAALGLATLPASAQQTVDSVLSVEKQAAEQGRKSQARIDRIDEETQNLLSDFQTVSQSIDDLRIFNAQLQAQIDGQVKTIGQLEQSIDDIATIRRQITPEMVAMVDALEKFVQGDIPFRRTERLERVADLREYLQDGGITEAERFRLILDAFTQEVEYGRSVETYSGPVTHNGEQYDNVQFLRLGRVGLYYKALGTNTSVVGLYDKTTDSFATLDKSYVNTIAAGIAFANKTANAELLMLPVPAPEGR
ncbi:MAG: DUF3450 domain-containing protein [Sphingomonadales bacterium]